MVVVITTGICTETILRDICAENINSISLYTFSFDLLQIISVHVLSHFT